jgi:hypothetical protein
MTHSRKSQALFLVALVLVGLVGYTIHSADRKSKANQPAALHGEQAIGSLKQDGMYDSLQAAVSAARYRIYACAGWRAGRGLRLFDQSDVPIVFCQWRQRNDQCHSSGAVCLAGHCEHYLDNDHV